MYNSRVKNIELPENLFSNLGEVKSKKIEQKNTVPVITNDEKVINNYNFDNEVKLTNYSNRKEYRNRIDKMYEDLKDIKPIDNDVDGILYFNNYVEKGIVIKPKVSSLKQFWTEYRLISNEKTDKNHKIQITSNEKITDFDSLFDALSQRVSEINKYIDELKEMKTNLDIKSEKLEKDKEKLADERKKFQNYKKSEENRIKEEKENLKVNFTRLQTIIDDLDKKLVDIEIDKK